MLAILFYHASFSFFLIIDLYFLILPAIAQILNPIAELVSPKGIPIKKAKAESELHPVTKCSIKFRVVQNF